MGTMVAVTFAQTAQYNPALSVFLKPITEEFGWSRSTFAGAITVGTLVGGFLAVFIGPILDKRGPRAVVFIGFVVLGAATMGIALVSELWHFYAMIITGRALIAGLLSIVAGVVVSKWFVRRRGRAMAFAVIGTRLGQVVMPLYVQMILLFMGWRIAALALGGLVWAVTLAPAVLLLRRQPEDMGLLPDGDTVDETVDSVDGKSGSPPRAVEVSLTLKQAMRTRSFYFIVFATSGLAFNIGGINFNLYPYLTDQGISNEGAITVLTAWSAVSAVGALAVGFLAERFHVRFVMAVAFGIVTLGVLVLMATKALPMAYLFAAIHGLAFGALPMLMQLVWADYFGRAHQGAIRGFVTPVQLVLQAGGPLTGTLIYDMVGNYFPAFILFSVIYLASALAMLLAKPLVHQRASIVPSSTVR